MFLSSVLVAACGLFPPRPERSAEPAERGGEGGENGGSAGSGRGGAESGSSGGGTETGGASGGGEGGERAGGSSGGTSGNPTTDMGGRDGNVGGTGGTAAAGGGAGEGGDAGEGGAGGEGGTREDEPFRPLPGEPVSITPVEAVAMKRGPAPGAYHLVDVMWVDAARTVRHAGLTDQGFSTVPVGGSTNFSPVVLPRSDGLMDLFITADEGGLRTKGWQYGAWSPPNPDVWQVPRFGPVHSQLSGTSWSPDHLDIFGLDLDGSVRHLKWRSVGSWDTTWETLPGVAAQGKVSAVALFDNAIQLFVRQTNGLLARGSYVERAGVRGNWEPLPTCGDEIPSCWCGQVKEAPAVAKLGESELALAFRTDDDSLWFATSENDGFSCVPLGVTSSRPPVFLVTRSRLVLFRFDSDGVVMMASIHREGSEWSQWSSLNAKLTDMSGANVDPTRSYLFGRTETGTVVYRELHEDP